MKHFSSFVKSGARLLGVRGHWAAQCLAFENADGSIVLVIKNCLNEPAELSIHARQCFSARLEPGPINTIVVKDAE